MAQVAQTPWQPFDDDDDDDDDDVDDDDDEIFLCRLRFLNIYLFIK